MLGAASHRVRQHEAESEMLEDARVTSADS